MWKLTEEKQRKYRRRFPNESFKSKIVSRKTNGTLYRTVIRPVGLYKCELGILIKPIK